MKFCKCLSSIQFFIQGLMQNFLKLETLLILTLLVMRYSINSSSISLYTPSPYPPPHMDGNVNFLCKVRLHVSNIKEMDGQQLLHHLEDRFHLHYSRHSSCQSTGTPRSALASSLCTHIVTKYNTNGSDKRVLPR